MANDVVINVKANDLASRIFENIAKSANNASSSVNRFGNSASRINEIVNSMAGFTAATIGLNGLADAFHSTAGAALGFYKEMQSGAIATAGTLMSVAQINGKDLGWNQSMEYSTTIMKKLANQAVATGVATKELSDSFRAALPAALQGGMTIDQLIKVLAPLTSAGKLIGLNDTTLMRDINDIMSGQNVGRTKLGQVLGLSSEEIKQAKDSGKLFEFLMERLQGEAMATTKYLETFEGRINHLKEAFARVGGMGLESTFNQIKEDIQAVAEKLLIVDQKTQEVYIRQEALDSFKEIGRLITVAENQLKLLASDFSSGGSLLGGGLVSGIKMIIENLRTAVKTVAALWVGSKILSYINDVKAGLVGTAQAHTLIGRAAAAAREEIVKEQLAQKQLLASMEKASTVNAVNGKVNVTGSNTAIEQTNAALAAKATKAREAAAAMNEAATAEVAGQEAVRLQVQESNLALSAQAQAYRNVGVQSVAAAEKQAAGQTVALRSQELTNASLALTTMQTRKVGIQATAAGEAGALANYKAYSGMGTVITGLKGIGKAVLALTGGWVGLGLAAAYAIYEMNSAYQEKRDFRNNHAEVVNGDEITTDQEGNYYTKYQYKSGFWEWRKADNLSDDVKKRYNELSKYRANKKEADEWQAQLDHAKEVQALMPKEENPNVETPKELDSATYKFGDKDEKEAKAAALAADKMAKAMDQNANIIQKANERIAGVIESLNTQLLKMNGSTYDAQMAEAQKSYNDTLKNINQSIVSLKTVTTGSSNVGAAIVNEAASHDGEQWMSPEVADATVQCAAFVSALYQGAGISGLNSNNGDTLVSQFGDAYHSSYDYTPKAGDLINWENHVGISDGQGGYWARNSKGGVHHGDMSEAESWFGPALGYGSIDEYTGGGTVKTSAVTDGGTYAPTEQMDKAKSLAQQLLEAKQAEIERQLTIRQRKQSYETELNTLEGGEGDNRLEIINLKYKEQEAQSKDKKKDIYKAIAGDESKPGEKARAEAEAEKAINAEILNDERKKNQEIRELEDTQHSERMTHLENEAYMNKSYAAELTSLKSEELQSYIEMKQKELDTASLSASERLSIEKDLVAAQKELDAERQKSMKGGWQSLKDEIRNYEADAGAAMKEGWDGVQSAFTEFGQNMITEHQSLTTRLKNMWKNMANSILNSLMKIAMQKTLQNLIMAIGGNKKANGGEVKAAADGGYIVGPGTSTSDSIPTWLSNGEYVINAAVVKKVGVGFLDSLNNGYVKHFASGGYVGAAAKPSIKAESTGGVQIIIENNTGTPMKATSKQENDGNRQITKIILSTVQDAIVSNEGHMRELIAGVR